MAAAFELEVAMVVGGLGFALAAAVAFFARRIGSRAVAAAWMAVLAFVALIFGLLSAGFVDGSTTVWNWGAAASYVWIPAAAAILVGGLLGWTFGARRGG